MIENNTDHAICVSYQGTGNGWTISHSIFGNSGSNVAKKSKAKTFLWFEYDALAIQHFSDLESATLTFSVETLAEDFGASGKTYFTVDDLTIDFAGGGETVRELAYFSESPSLPLPTSYTDVYESGSGKSTLNGKTTSIRYSYRPSSHADSAADMLKQYVDGLKNAGYAVNGSANSYTIRNGNTKLATVSLEGSTFKIEIEPGNEGLTDKSSAASAVSGKIAGYEVSELVLVYAGEAAGGKADPGKTHFISVYVNLKATDSMAAFKDLSSKLTTVYGKANKTFYETGSSGMRMWTGNHDTAVILRCISAGEAELIYGKIGSYETLQALQTAAGAPVDSTDTSGL